MNHQVIYEISLNIKKSIYSEFSSWLEAHIQEIANLPGFISAKLYDMQDNGDDCVKHVIHYFLDSMQSLNTYREKHAPALRKDGTERFGNDFSVERRILSYSKSYAHK